MTDVLLSEGSPVRVITLNRPDKRNALNEELIDALKEALRTADADAAVACVVIKGAGKDFCSGADLQSLQKIAGYSLDENVADAMNLAGLFELIRHIRVPVIAAVHGRALAGGCGLATACDLVLAASSARFGYPEVKLGFVPAMVTAILRRNLGEKQTFELLTRGFEFSAEDAFDLGLVNELFEDDGFETGVSSYADVYASLSRSAVEMTKRLLYSMDTHTFSDSLRQGAETNAEARMSDDCKAGIARFLNKT